MQKQLLSFGSLMLGMGTLKLLTSSMPHEQPRYSDVQELYVDVQPQVYYSLVLPQKIFFANEEAPLEEYKINWRFQRELNAYAGMKPFTFPIIQRANRYFPIIRPILKKHGIPDDFKYLPLVESGFKHGVSRVGAAGFWQIMPVAAREYGLRIDGQVDERYHLEKSTEMACRYFKDAYEIFGNWTMVAAAYNMGVYGFKHVRDYQQPESFYDMALNVQTTRYIYRILALKEIMAHPSQYGFDYTRKDLLPPLAVKKVKVKKEVKSWVAWARSHGLKFNELKALNPWIRSTYFANTDKIAYCVNIPSGKRQPLPEPEEIITEPVVMPELPEEAFAEAAPETESGAVPKDTLSDPTFIRHKVKKGESLYTIGRKYKVKPAQIMAWNGMQRILLREGKEVVIYPKDR